MELGDNIKTLIEQQQIDCDTQIREDSWNERESYEKDSSRDMRERGGSSIDMRER